MKKDLGLIFGLFLVIFVLLIFGRNSTSTVFFANREAIPGAAKSDSVNFKARDLQIMAKLVDTPDERKTGLGGLESLDLDKGLFFVFETSDNYTFWMKDVNFAIDIIWIDVNKRIVHIAENVPPEPGVSDSKLKRYQPNANARYVLEINAGLSNLHGLKVGDSVTF